MLSPLSGKTLEECMTSQKMAFLQTVIHNNLIGGSVDKKPDENTVPTVIWKPAPTDLRHTNPQVQATSGRWSKRGWSFLCK